MKKFKNIILRRKPTLAEQVDSARGQAEDALNMFTQAHQKLEDANTLLVETVEDAQKQRSDLDKQIERATIEINMNKSVQAKLTDFVIN